VLLLLRVLLGPLLLVRRCLKAGVERRSQRAARGVQVPVGRPGALRPRFAHGGCDTALLPPLLLQLAQRRGDGDATTTCQHALLLLLLLLDQQLVGLGQQSGCHIICAVWGCATAALRYCHINSVSGSWRPSPPRLIARCSVAEHAAAAGMAPGA
jgi:hypothetical protein